MVKAHIIPKISEEKGELVVTSYQARNIKFIPVTENEIKNLGNLSIILQIFFGASTTFLGSFLSVAIQKFSPNYKLNAIVEIIFWVSLACFIIFGITTGVVFKIEGKDKKAILSDK